MKVQKWLIRKQWRKFIYGAISVQKCKKIGNLPKKIILSIVTRKIRYRHENAVIVQSVMRTVHALRTHRPRQEKLLYVFKNYTLSHCRYKGISNLRKLSIRTQQLGKIGKQTELTCINNTGFVVFMQMRKHNVLGPRLSFGWYGSESQVAPMPKAWDQDRELLSSYSKSLASGQREVGEAHIRNCISHQLTNPTYKSELFY